MLAQAADLLRRTAPLADELHAQRIPATNLHATLCFLGAVEPERVGALKAAAAGMRSSAVALRFAALDYWSKPGILCATADEGHASVHELAERVTAAVLAAGF